ncbi:unnamed protein product [Brachionus calyciflorus]|uniref:C-type lectin domain-containing protein n=1 Tax=Brachionus calyciflorus TaxID=104777 RepID=A0A813SWY6_9BILA|nr:unnamed protein product [Brachionus calyciflorus]
MISGQVLIFYFTLGQLLFNIVNLLPINNACEHLPYDFHNIPGTRDYYFLRYELKNVQGANDYCNSIGMNLPSIQTPAQNALIYRFLQQTNIDRGLFHTSGRILEDNTFVWSNGDSVTYTNFGVLPKYDINFNSIAINKTNGKWLTVPFDLEAGVFCHIRC